MNRDEPGAPINFIFGTRALWEFVLFFASTAILSRLLTPENSGYTRSSSALTAVIAASFQEFGGANYLIQNRRYRTEISAPLLRLLCAFQPCLLLRFSNFVT